MNVFIILPVRAQHHFVQATQDIENVDGDFEREFDFEGANVCDDETEIDFDNYVFLGTYKEYGWINVL